MRSTIPAAKAAVLAALAARPALAAVQREWAHPGGRIEPESIFLGRVKQDEMARAMGPRRREEVYSLDVVVNVEFEGDDPQSCEQRLWDLVHEVEEAFVADPRFGGLVITSGITAINQTTVGGDQRRESEAVIELTCKAHKEAS